MSFNGFTNREIAERTGKTESTISSVLRSPLGQAYLNGLHDTAKENTLDVRKKLISMNAQALSAFDRILKPTSKAPYNVQFSKAKDILERVLEKKQAIPFTRFTDGVGHRAGAGITAGRFPEKASKEFIKLIKDAEANAQTKGLSTELKIVHLLAHKGSNDYHYGRQRRRKYKRTHLEIVVEEQEEKKADKKKNPQKTTKPKVKEEKDTIKKETKPTPEKIDEITAKKPVSSGALSTSQSKSNEKKEVNEKQKTEQTQKEPDKSKDTIKTSTKPQEENKK